MSQPTPDEITRNEEVETAFMTVMEAERTRIFDLIETEYNVIKTTTEPFVKSSDLKWLRK